MQNGAIGCLLDTQCITMYVHEVDNRDTHWYPSDEEEKAYETPKKWLNRTEV